MEQKTGNIQKDRLHHKKKALFLPLLLLLALTSLANAPASITITTGVKIAGKYGNLVASKTMTMASMTDYANGTMLFNVTGYELSQLTYQFSLTSYGNGTWPIRFAGRIPTSTTALNAATNNYNSPWQQITYTTAQTTPLIIVYAAGYPIEPQTVGFRDDFLYPSPLLSADWTIDPIKNPNNQPGIYTSSGYLIMTNTNNKTAQTAIETHVSSIPVLTPTSLATGTLVKRKLTVALVPFRTSHTGGTPIISATGQLNLGFTHLITAPNPYPQTGNQPPYNTPNPRYYTICQDSRNPQDNIGTEMIFMYNDGSTFGASCGDPSGTAINTAPFPNIDPTRYTVFTIETSAVYCSSCPDNAQPGTSWVWYRVYQEDSSGNIILGTDNNFNQTTNIAPYYGTAPVYFFASIHPDGTNTQTTSIDFVQWQNYGSPVCLIAPTGALCTRLPPNPGHITNDFVGSIAWLATLLGGGDEQAGAIILFLLMSLGMAGIPYLFTRNIPFASLGEMSVLGFNIYAGFLPAWILFLVLLMGAVIIVMMVNKIIAGQGLFGGGAVTE